MRHGWVLASLLLTLSLAAPAVGVSNPDDQPTDPIPHVVVGVPDSGINPYHQAFHRPGLTDHPCTYLEGFPCSIEKLELSLDIAHDQGYEAAVAADEDTWENLEEDTLYWIPETPFVAVLCTGFEGSEINDVSETCILDDGTSHGTGTTYSVITENPDALFAFQQGGASTEPLGSQVPVDVWSVSWGTIVPVPFPSEPPERPFYVKSAGNDPRSTLVDGWSGHPQVISVGGAYSQGFVLGDGSSEAMAAKQPDLVGPYCREVARADAISNSSLHSVCGTSFSAPTAAGALSKTILSLREDSGWTGSITSDGYVDGPGGFTVNDVWDAVNRTATYSPTGQPSDRSTVGLTVPPQAPWLQWGWGWYDGAAADSTIKHLLEDDSSYPEKSFQAKLWMGTTHDASRTLYGW